MQSAVREKSRSGALHAGLSIRVGFHGGPVLEEKGDVFGDAVNLAARMAGLSKAHQVLTTRQMADRLGSALRPLARFMDRRDQGAKRRIRPVRTGVGHRGSDDGGHAGRPAGGGRQRKAATYLAGPVLGGGPESAEPHPGAQPPVRRGDRGLHDLPPAREGGVSQGQVLPLRFKHERDVRRQRAGPEAICPPGPGPPRGPRRHLPRARAGPKAEQVLRYAQYAGVAAP